MRNGKETIDVTMIGTLPPLKGISPYCAELAVLLSEYMKIEFLDFKRLYPERFYPGKTEEDDLYPVDITSGNIARRRMLDFCNPYTWFKAGFGMSGRVVHAQWWTGILAPVYLVVLAIARLRGKRVIITVHNVDPHENRLLLRFLNDCVLPLGDEFIVHGNTCREKLTRKVKGRKRVHAVPHPPLQCSRDAGDGVMDAVKTRTELGIDERQPLLLFFGNIRDYKGLDVLLKAMPKVIDVHPDARLLVAGQPWGDWEKYDRIIVEERIQDNVITRLEFLPFRELEKLIVAADITVFPFRHLDSASSSVVLAYSLGKTIVASDVGDLAEMRGDGIYLVQPDCPQSLAETIDTALRRNLEEGGTRFPGDARSRELNGTEVAHGHMTAYRGTAAYPPHVTATSEDIPR